MAKRNRTVGKELTTSNSTIYTVPDRFTAEVMSVIISNGTSSAVTFSLDWYDAINATYYTIAEAAPIAANGFLQITDGFMLQAGDSFRGLASANSAVTVTVRTEEEYSVVK